jgi:hypothetical protein
VLCVPAGRGGEGTTKCDTGLFFFILLLVLVHGGFMFLCFVLFWLRGEGSGSKCGGLWSVWCLLWEFPPAACWRRAPSPRPDSTVVGQPSRLLRSSLAGVLLLPNFKWFCPRSSGGDRAWLPRRIWRRWCLDRITFCICSRGLFALFFALSVFYLCLWGSL